jgi:NAD(P)-dependent dehydrogenase (short-subunit alcohol dehydrogenase family)
LHPQCTPSISRLFAQSSTQTTRSNSSNSSNSSSSSNMSSPTWQSPYYSIISFSLFIPLTVVYTTLVHSYFWITRQKPTFQTTKATRSKETIAIVTGSNTGIGLATAKGLAEAGCTVIMACRSRDKAMQAIEAIKSDRIVFVAPLDLNSQQSIRDFCVKVMDKYPEIHILVNNAGCNTTSRLKSSDVMGETGTCSNAQDRDGLFQSNFVGHYYLTSLLLPRLEHGGRIVNLSSCMHHFCGSYDITKEETWRDCILYDRPPGQTYAMSKLASILFSLELRNRYKVEAIAVNPGAV